MTITGKAFAEFAGDIQSGLGSYEVGDFDDLRTIGMAASLAVQLRGLPEIDYSVLQQVSAARFDIPTLSLNPVVRLLSEVGMVRLVESGKSILKVDPQVPYFEDVYQTIGSVADEYKFTETEQAMVRIMAELFQRPENKDRLLNRTGIDQPMMDRCLEIGEQSGLITNQRARGRSILISPVYFADNASGLADLIAKSGSDDFKVVMEILTQHQGWPLEMVLKQSAIAGKTLTPVQVELIRMLATENMLKPPTIEIGQASIPFLFTPRPGAARLTPGKREIYERAMALLSAVRKGQLLPFAYPIRSPKRLLQSFLDNGYLGANTEAYQQYGKVALTHNIGYFEETKPGWHRFILRKTDENIEAVNTAIALADGGSVSVDMRNDAEARALLQQDDKFVRSVLGAKKMKARPSIAPSAAAQEQWEQMTLRLGNE